MFKYEEYSCRLDVLISLHVKMCVAVFWWKMSIEDVLLI